MKQAEPNPLAGRKEIAVLPIDFEGLRIGGRDEAKYLADEKNKPEDLAKVKAEVDATFAKSLTAIAKAHGVSITKGPPAGADALVLRPRVRTMEPGFFAFVASGPSKIVLDLTVEDTRGQVLDHVAMDHGTSPTTWEKVEAAARWRDDAAWLGRTAGEYVVHRVSGGE